MITPLEAMARGPPVVALAEAMTSFEKGLPQLDPQRLCARATLIARPRFSEEIQRALEECVRPPTSDPRPPTQP